MLAIPGVIPIVDGDAAYAMGVTIDWYLDRQPRRALLVRVAVVEQVVINAVGGRERWIPWILTAHDGGQARIDEVEHRVERRCRRGKRRWRRWRRSRWRWRRCRRSRWRWRLRRCKGCKDVNFCQVESASVAWQHDRHVPTSYAVTVDGEGTVLSRNNLVVNAACLGGGRVTVAR